MFLKNLPLQQCDATAIADTVSFIRNKGISMNKVVMLTTDGAAIMLGCRNGVHIKLKEYTPHLLEFHCVAHREALAVSQAYKSVDYFISFGQSTPTFLIRVCEWKD